MGRENRPSRNDLWRRPIEKWRLQEQRRESLCHQCLEGEARSRGDRSTNGENETRPCGDSQITDHENIGRGEDDHDFSGRRRLSKEAAEKKARLSHKPEEHVKF